MTASEKVAYLKGLADGLGIDKSTSDGKLMLAIIDVIDSLALDVEDLEANLADMADSIDEMSEDIAYVEELALDRDLDDYDDDDFGFDDDPCFSCDTECSGNCASCAGCMIGQQEIVCPECGEELTVFEDDIEFGSILCPECGKEIDLDELFDEDDEDDED